MVLTSNISIRSCLAQPAENQSIYIQNETTNKSEGFWEEVCRKYDHEADGYTYTFRLIDSYNIFVDASKVQALKTKSDELYPAIQTLPQFLVFLDMTSSRESIENDLYEAYLTHLGNPKNNTAAIKSIVENTLDDAHIFHFLGYEMKREADNVYLILPDAAVFNYRWKNLQKISPELPSLSIIPSENVVDHVNFVDHFLRGEIPLSTEKEFIHDHVIHIISTIFRIIANGFPQSNDRFFLYNQALNETRERIRTWRDRINDIESQRNKIKTDIDGLRTILSIVVDVSTSTNNNQKFKNTGQRVEYIFDSVRWDSYMTTRFDENWKTRIYPLWLEISSAKPKAEACGAD